MLSIVSLMSPESHEGASKLPQVHPEHMPEEPSVLQGIRVDPDTQKLVLPPLSGLTKSTGTLNAYVIETRSNSTSQGTITTLDQVATIEKSLIESPSNSSAFASLPSAGNTSETVTSSASPRAILSDIKIRDISQKQTTVPSPTPPQSSSPHNTSPPTTNASMSTTRTGDLLKEKKGSFDFMISKVLGMEANELVHWPCTSETLNELLRLKIEQERTKQEQMRGEHSQVTVDLLKLAQSLNLPMDLISYILSPANTVDESRYSIGHNEPHDVFSKLRSRLTELETYYSASGSRNKRKHGDSHLYSYHDSAEVLRSHFISPARSPDSLPHTLHRRILSDSSENSANHGSGITGRSSPQQLPAKPGPSSGLPTNQALTEGDSQPPVQGMIIAPPPQLQQHIAQFPYPPYPMYYHLGPPPPMPAPPGASSEGIGGPNDNSTNYGHKYPGTMMYPGGPYGIPAGANTNPRQPQGPQYYPQQPLSYFVQGNQVVCVPDQQDVAPGSRSSSSLQPSSKKAKHSHKNNNINFMITTPKNPPARKYNNPKNNSASSS